MPASRQLAAIMFTDIVGYTALMGEDEQRAFDLLRKNRQLQKPLIEKFNGKWIKELGDGVLASFSTVTDAVLCATEIQHACGGINGLKLRIGIHQGEVVFEDDDVFGDGVNIASRLQASAPIGGIWISESAYKNISNKREIAAQFVKAEHFKNVKEAVRIYEVIIEPANKSEISPTAQNLVVKSGGKRQFKLAVPFIAVGLIIVLIAGYFIYNIFLGKASQAKSKNKIKSIVVLYFNNMTGDPGQEYFCDGITEEITDRLTKVKGLEVKSRHSALSFKNRPINATKIADELKVDVLIEGSYRKSGNTGKITVQLINGKTDDHYWSDDFTMELTDIFKVQSEIAIAIAKKLEADLSPETIARINERGTNNIEAYDNFLRGSFFHYTKYFNTRLYEDFKRSKKYFEVAIQLDPGYADAYAGLSDLYDSYSAEKIATDKIPTIFELKEQLARKALALNPNSAMANTAMAWAIHNRQKGHPGDSSLFFAKRAHYLAPSDPLYSHALSFIAATYGLDSLAIPICKEAIKADPIEPNHYAILGYQCAMLGKYKEAKQALHKSFELTNDKFDDEKFALFWLTYFREFKTVEERLESRPEPKYNQARSFLFASKGEFSKIDSISRRDTIFMLYVDLLTNSNKVSKNVLNRLEAGVDEGSWDRIYKYDFLKTAYYFDAYRSNADFKRILAKAKKVQDDNLVKYEKFDVSN